MITSASSRPTRRTFVPQGAEQQGRQEPTIPMPAEACTEVGQDQDTRRGFVGWVMFLVMAWAQFLMEPSEPKDRFSNGTASPGEVYAVVAILALAVCGALHIFLSLIDNAEAFLLVAAP